MADRLNCRLISRAGPLKNTYHHANSEYSPLRRASPTELLDNETELLASATVYLPSLRYGYFDTLTRSSGGYIHFYLTQAIINYLFSFSPLYFLRILLNQLYFLHSSRIQTMNYIRHWYYVFHTMDI